MKNGTSFADPIVDTATVDWYINLLKNLCSPSDGSPQVCVWYEGSFPTGSGCSNPCNSDSYLWGYTFPGGNPPQPPNPCGLIPIDDGDPCRPLHHPKQPKASCGCAIVICDSTFVSYNPQSPCAVLFHEFGHCGGYGHSGGEKQPPGIELGCCVCSVLKGPGKCGDECQSKVAL